MTSPTYLFAGLLALTALGIVGLVWSLVCWSSIGQRVNDTLVKVAGKVIQVVAVYAGLRGAYEVASHKDDWWPAAVSGVVCGVVWECLVLLVDNRVKAADTTAKDALARAERVGEDRTRLLTVFREAVNGKVRRMMRAVGRRGPRAIAGLVRSALTPESHLDDLLLNLAVYFSVQLPQEHSRTRNFRVGLYVNRDGSMVPIRAVNLNNPAYDVFSSYRANSPAYRLDAGDGRAHVVRCVRRRETIIVEDCVAAADRGEFAFFSDDQRSYLRSMLAYYLDAVCLETGKMTPAALVIDTDAPGFFREADRDALEFCLREFGSRVKLELLLESLLNPRPQPS